MSRRSEAITGLVVVGTGILGALSALTLIFWPAQVAEELLSYPFTTTGFLVVQAWFFVHHFGLVLGALTLITSDAVGAGRLGRVGSWTAVAGLLMLAFAELFAMRYAAWDSDAAHTGPMGTAYGVSTMLIGIGMLAAGAGVLRAGLWSGWHAWTPLAIGVAAFAVVTPGMFGGFVVGRLAIGFWMGLFAALGWSFYVESRRAPAAVILRPAAPVGPLTTG